MASSTPAPTTPTTKRSALHDTPKKAERFVKKYVGITHNTTAKDPSIFNLKPGVWQEWPPDRFRRFIDYLRLRVDLIAFAHQENISVEEVQEVFNQTICDDLYSIEKVATERLARRMKAQMKLRCEKGEQVRLWTKDKIAGELYKAKVGQIELVTGDEHEIVLTPAQLDDEDRKYLRTVLTDQQWRFLHADMQELRRYLNGEDLSDSAEGTLPVGPAGVPSQPERDGDSMVG